MPSKYAIHTRKVPHRFTPIVQSGIVAWEEGCLRCAVCVKTQCVYGVYDHRDLDPRQMVDTIDTQCMNCLRCVQGCPKQLIHKTVNPEYQGLGDAHWTPEIISRLWYQAETGKVPVSGAGYSGPFTGPGFDAMWTDMSEIVRPTRDGIHGREYIATGIDVGRAPKALTFDETGAMTSDDAHMVDIPLPILFQIPGFGAFTPATLKGWAEAAKRLGTLLVLPDGDMEAVAAKRHPWVVPSMDPDISQNHPIPADIRMVEIPWRHTWPEPMAEFRTAHPDWTGLECVRMPMHTGVENRVLSLVQDGVAVIHLAGDDRGYFQDDSGRYLKDGIRAVHLKLMEAGLRDETTLLVSGGIAMAEHVPKAVICGADGVLIDFPLLIALECRMCRRCTWGLSCPVEIDTAPSSWVTARVMNLVGAWHNQLLEVMGAMGIRDARRLRGEAGRAMFFDALDRETFGAMNRMEEGCELE